MEKRERKQPPTRRRVIERKLGAALARALREYREVFRRLAAYDRA
jgi:hypothetical protein